MHIKKSNEVRAMFVRHVECDRALGVNIVEATRDMLNNDIEEVLREYQEVRPDDLPKGLPPERGQPQLKVELKADTQPHKEGIHQLFEKERQVLLRQLRYLRDKDIL